jgi:hypothetical protein
VAWQKGGVGPTFRTVREERVLRGVDDFECLAFRGIDEFVVDEQPGSVKFSHCPQRMEGGFTVVDMIFRLEVESTQISHQARTIIGTIPLLQTCWFSICIELKVGKY